MYPTYYSRNIVNRSTGFTAATTDAGTVQNFTVDGLTATLPAVAAANVGLTLTFRNGGANNGDVGFTVAPNAADSMNGLGFTAANGKGAINTKATARPGDEITVVSSGSTGAGGWYITNAVGTFARVP